MMSGKELESREKLEGKRILMANEKERETKKKEKKESERRERVKDRKKKKKKKEKWDERKYVRWEGRWSNYVKMYLSPLEVL